MPASFNNIAFFALVGASAVLPWLVVIRLVNRIDRLLDRIDRLEGEIDRLHGENNRLQIEIADYRAYIERLVRNSKYL